LLFNSFGYVVFLACVCGLYALVPVRARWLLLLGASYYFYMSWRVEYVVLILGSTIIDYVAARRIAANPGLGERRAMLALSIVANLGLLFSFKYYGFFSSQANELLRWASVPHELPSLAVLLPVGISFYTFQSMSYTIDVYRGVREPERHFGRFALYVSFFPQLVAGPIERSTSLLPQLGRLGSIRWENIAPGLQMVLWGFFKKLVIADNLAPTVERVYSNPEAFTGIEQLAATYAFAFQIYFDFSAYSDIAVGTARLFGVELRRNFRLPYAAKSIPEFWHRWHISLSTWFRDYLFVPLGGSRGSSFQWSRNIIAVFVLSGLWHGANWTFVLWGAVHALCYLAARLKESWLPVSESISWLRSTGGRVFTFHIVVLAWVFFRAETVGDAWIILKGVGSVLATVTTDIAAVPALVGSGFALWTSVAFATGWVAVPVAELVEYRLTKKPLFTVLRELPAMVRWGWYYAVTVGTVLMGNFRGPEFIYFQF
jgi:D-alanyl-lipoteichoic acid acyltransferase DltB (MBOAT superfamily)